MVIPGFKGKSILQIPSYTSGSAAKTANVETRCPHGSVPGSCPACSGGGGGGGVKKSTAGLMSWNEAYATWHAIQLAEARQKDYLQSSAFQQERLQREVQTQAIRNLVQALWARFANGAPPFLANVGLVTVNTLRAAVSILNAPRTLVATLRERIIQPLIDITDKLATMLGDAKKLLDDIFHHNLEVLKSLIAQFQWQERMAQVQSLMKRVLGQFSPRKILSGLADRAKSLFAKIWGLFEQPKKEDERFF